MGESQGAGGRPHVVHAGQGLCNCLWGQERTRREENGEEDLVEWLPKTDTLSGIEETAPAQESQWECRRGQ